MKKLSLAILISLMGMAGSASAQTGGAMTGGDKPEPGSTGSMSKPGAGGTSGGYGTSGSMSGPDSSVSPGTSGTSGTAGTSGKVPDASGQRMKESGSGTSGSSGMSGGEPGKMDSGSMSSPAGK